MLSRRPLRQRYVAAAGATADTRCAPGTFTSGPGQSECTPCGPGTYQGDFGATSCFISPSGSFVAADAATEPTLCPPGTSSGSGVAGCTPCEQNTYTNHSGMTSCYLCAPPLKTSHAGATHCDACTAQHYWDTPVWETAGLPALLAAHAGGDPEAYSVAQCGRCCVICPEEGAKCDEPGVTLETIPMKRNYWRATSYSDELHLCRLRDACFGGEGNRSLDAVRDTRYCREGNEGVLCGVCAEDYMFDGVENACVACRDPPFDIRGSVQKLVSIAIIFAVVACGFAYYARKKHMSTQSILRLGAVAAASAKGGRLDAIKDAGEILEEERQGKEEAAAEAEAEDKDEGNLSFTAMFTKVKILIGLYQIIGSTTWSLPQVNMPDIVKAPLAMTGFFNFDIVSVVPLDCFRRVNYFESLCFTTLLPLVVAGFIVVAGGLKYAASTTKEGKHKAYARVCYLLALLSFCVLPGCASMSLRYFGCARYVGPRRPPFFLRARRARAQDLGDYERGADGWVRQTEKLWILVADTTIRCHVRRYRRWRLFVGLMILVYPIGVPLGYFLVLWSLRHELNPDVDGELLELEAEAEEKTGAIEDDEEFAEHFVCVAHQVFDLIDKNENGVLDKKEILRSVREDEKIQTFFENAGLPDLVHLLEPARLEKALEALDTNRDGVLDGDEWDAAIERGLAERLRERFDERAGVAAELKQQRRRRSSLVTPAAAAALSPRRRSSIMHEALERANPGLDPAEAEAVAKAAERRRHSLTYGRSSVMATAQAKLLEAEVLATTLEARRAEKIAPVSFLVEEYEPRRVRRRLFRSLAPRPDRAAGATSSRFSSARGGSR